MGALFCARPLPGAGMAAVLFAGSSTLSITYTTELHTVVLLSTLAVLPGYSPVTCTCTRMTLVCLL